MPNAKSFFPEDHPNYIGVFWVNISTPYCGETVSDHRLLSAGHPFPHYLPPPLLFPPPHPLPLTYPYP